jgi:hypothetical protein
LEACVHGTAQEGLQCLRANLKSEALLPWTDTFSKFYVRGRFSRWASAVCSVGKDLFLLSFMPYIYDVYSDISLAVDYFGFAFLNQTFNSNETVTCSGSQLSSCFENSAGEMLDQMSLADRHRFKVSFWVTLTAIVASLLFYFCCVAFDSIPAFANSVSQRVSVWGRRRRWSEPVVRYFVFSSWLFLAFPFVLLWPLLHLWRCIKSKASLKPSQLGEQITKSDKAWNNTKAVEYGIESSLQLILQLWLLSPFLLSIAAWSNKDLAISCVTGIANFITFNSYPACYVEKALGKILIAVISLTLGVAQMMSHKPGLGEKPVNTTPIIVSVLAQTTGRMYALSSLILFAPATGYSKYAIFFTFHYVIVFLIKILCETTSSFKVNISRFCSGGLSKKHYDWTTFWNVVKFITSGFSSAIVMIHLQEEDQPFSGRKSRFISHTLFFLLILVENLVVVVLPYMAPRHLYPPVDCYIADSQAHAVWAVLGLWSLGRVCLYIYIYKKYSTVYTKSGSKNNIFCVNYTVQSRYFSYFPPFNLVLIGAYF